MQARPIPCSADRFQYVACGILKVISGMGLACETTEQHGKWPGRSSFAFSLTKYFPFLSHPMPGQLMKVAKTHPAQCVTLHNLGPEHSANFQFETNAVLT